MKTSQTMRVYLTHRILRKRRRVGSFHTNMGRLQKAIEHRLRSRIHTALPRDAVEKSDKSIESNNAYGHNSCTVASQSSKSFPPQRLATCQANGDNEPTHNQERNEIIP